jgi:hypothetical protein
MKRREFITLGSAAAVWPLGARAQQRERMRRIGILMPFPPTNAEMQSRVRAFREELRKRGWASGLDAQFDERWTSDNMDLIRSAATNLVELGPDAILAVGGRVIPILMELTRSIPIVNAGGSDPIARGYARSLAHPGGNVTGFAIMEPSLIGKMLQMLKEIAPNVARVSLIYNPDNPVARLNPPPGCSASSRSWSTSMALPTSSVPCQRLQRRPMPASLSPRMSRSWASWSRLSQRLRSIGCRRSIPSETSWWAAAWSTTGRIASGSIAAPRPMSIVSCAVRKPAIYPTNCQPNTSW